MAKDLIAARGLAWRLFVRNISSQHRQAVLGYLWVVLPAIVMTLIWCFLRGAKVISFEAPGVPYPAFVLTGTLLWSGFVDSLNAPLRMMESNVQLLAKINFPREALILAGLAESVFNFVIRLVVLIPVILYFDVNLPTTAPLAVLGMIGLLLLGTTIGLLLVPLGMLYHDVPNGVRLVTSSLFFVTPIVYPPQQGGAASLLNWANPVSPPLLVSRDWLLSGPSAHTPAFLVVMTITAALFVLAWLLYRLAIPFLIERMSA